MKNLRIYFLAVMVLALSACGGKKQETKEAPVGKESATEVRDDWRVSTVVGTVTEIVDETRQLTLICSEGNLITVVAGEEVQRFDEILEGDIITFDYVVYMMAEFRSPTAEELAEPITIVAEVAKAPESFDPAGAVGAMIKAVVTIEALSRPFMRATIKGPLGNYLTLPMKDAAFMEELHIGQVFVLTYAEATAVSLTKL